MLTTSAPAAGGQRAAPAGVRRPRWWGRSGFCRRRRRGSSSQGSWPSLAKSAPGRPHRHARQLLRLGVTPALAVAALPVLSAPALAIFGAPALAVLGMPAFPVARWCRHGGATLAVFPLSGRNTPRDRQLLCWAFPASQGDRRYSMGDPYADHAPRPSAGAYGDGANSSRHAPPAPTARRTALGFQANPFLYLQRAATNVKHASVSREARRLRKGQQAAPCKHTATSRRHSARRPIVWASAARIGEGIPSADEGRTRRAACATRFWRIHVQREGKEGVETGNPSTVPDAFQVMGCMHLLKLLGSLKQPAAPPRSRAEARRAARRASAGRRERAAWVRPARR